MLSAYLDGAVSGKAMHSLDKHLRSCPACNGEYLALRRTQSLLAGIRPARVPDDLSLKLRLAISHEVARSRHSYIRVLAVHVENALRAFMVPATTGLVATILIFGLVAGILASPPSVHANAADVPLTFATEPELLPNSFGFTMGPVSDD
jgi:anti-sigma factor RsiW